MNVQLGRLGILCLVGVSLILLILLGTYFKVSRDVTHSAIHFRGNTTRHIGLTTCDLCYIILRSNAGFSHRWRFHDKKIITI